MYRNKYTRWGIITRPPSSKWHNFVNTRFINMKISGNKAEGILNLVDHLSPVKCPPSFYPQSNAPSRSLSRLVKAHTKLPILAAYMYLTVISISVAHCQIWICTIGSLVWALTKGASDRKGAFDWGEVTGYIEPGVNDLPLAWRNSKASDYSEPRASSTLLMSV